LSERLQPFQIIPYNTPSSEPSESPQHRRIDYLVLGSDEVDASASLCEINETSVFGLFGRLCVVTCNAKASGGAKIRAQISAFNRPSHPKQEPDCFKTKAVPGGFATHKALREAYLKLEFGNDKRVVKVVGSHALKASWGEPKQELASFNTGAIPGQFETMEVVESEAT
jgi:hypothetical protein